MSELSDTIKDLMNTSQKARRAEGSRVDIEISKTDIVKTPGFSGMKEYYDEATQSVIRRIYRQFAGGPEFDQAEDAFEKTKIDITRLSMPILFSALADG